MRLKKDCTCLPCLKVDSCLDDVFYAEKLLSHLEERTMSWCCLLPDLSTGLVFGVVLALAWWWRQSRPRNLPPGPSGHFLFGNLKDFGLRPEINFMKFAKQYGPVFKLYFANRLMVVLNGYDVIKATLVGQADAFADRPSLYINNTVTGINGLSQLPYGGRRLKEQRKFAFSCLREIGRVGKIELEEKIVQEMEVLSSTFDKMIGEPFEPYPVIFKGVSNIICNICFGSRFEYDDERFLTLLQTFDQEKNPTKKAALVQFVPWLRFLPSNRKLLNKIYDTCGKFIDVIKGIVEEHRQHFRPENEVYDVIDAFLLEQHKARESGDHSSSFTDDQLHWFLGDLYIAGSETTTRTLVWSLALLVAHPEVYKRLKAEINDVIGDARNPKMSDRHNMPYMEATILEILRFSTVAPLAVPHATTRDVVISGYNIPKDTFVFINLWSIHYAANTWADPDKFDPTHFLDADGQVCRPEAFMPFSGGARVCPGESLAKMDTFMFLTSLMQRFSFSLPSGADPLKAVHSDIGTGLPPPFKLRAERRK
ncbi:cytochrome P450 2D17-like isoform X1 [Haliotis rufescens]|uniref:cytochrome P450 2D17-like isoform X1 n=2 Tax=Haliotis rufescens TaxID=6454 RepID=UPI00201F0D36|nr:cytochrome P450 2D17-like isoform X1 [Haliotis rufescens]